MIKDDIPIQALLGTTCNLFKLLAMIDSSSKITNFLGSQIAALKMPLIPVTYHHVYA
jgi:hypothetical protein